MKTVKVTTKAADISKQDVYELLNVNVRIYVCVRNKKLECEAMYEIHKFFSYVIYIQYGIIMIQKLQKSTTCIDQDDFPKFNGGN